MNSSVDIQNDQAYPLDADALVRAAKTTLQAQDAASSGMTIVVTTDEAVQTLNRQYRAVDAPTDVLSFPADIPSMPDEQPYVGDLMIAYPYASAQAQREGHDLTQSLMLLVVHGTLHLLGYDHDSPQQRAEMWGVQESVLQQLNLPLDMVPSLEAADDD